MRSMTAAGLPSRSARPRRISRSCVERLAGHVLFADVLGVGGGDVHGDIVHQLLEIVGAGHEIGLAVDFHQDAELAAGVDVAADQALLGDARGLLVRGRDATLPQNDFRVAQVAVGLYQGALAVHHAGAGAVAELLYELSGDFGHNYFNLRKNGTTDGHRCTQIRTVFIRVHLCPSVVAFSVRSR